MDIHIVAMDSEPPSWRVYLDQYFIVCHSEAEAHETALRAAASLPLRARQSPGFAPRPGAPQQARPTGPAQPDVLSSSADCESES
ncbi:MAG: hypothetical protein AAAB13_02695 [Pseudomonas sp.]